MTDSPVRPGHEFPPAQAGGFFFSRPDFPVPTGTRSVFVCGAGSARHVGMVDQDRSVASPAGTSSTSHAPSPDTLEGFLGSGGVAGVLFTAPWCAAGVLLLRMLSEDPVVAPSGAAFVVVDCESHPHVADRFQVRSLPTFVLMRGEREEGRLLGAFSPPQVKSLMERPALARPPRSGVRP